MFSFRLDTEIRFSIKINQSWNAQLADNETIHYAMFSGQMEQAVSQTDLQSKYFSDI